MAKARIRVSREARAAYRDLEEGIAHLTRSIAEIRAGLGQAERRVEADARARVRALRKEARAQVAVLRARERDASNCLERLSAAAGGSWQEIKQTADAILADAWKVAAAVLARFREALGH